MMKYIHIIVFSLLLCACSKEMDPQQGTETTLIYEVTTDVQMEIKSPQPATEVNMLWYGVYHKKDDSTYRYMSDMSAFVEITDPSQITVPITLIKDQEYKIVFVAQYKDSGEEAYTYRIDSGDENQFAHMYLKNPDALPTDGDKMDVFTFCDEVQSGPGMKTKGITLTRPVAKVDVGTSADVLPDKLVLNVDGIPLYYDLFEGTYSNETVQLKYSGKPHGGGVIANGVFYSKLASFYAFYGSSVSCTLKLQYEGCAEKEVNVNGITLAPNYKTNIVGNI